VSVAQETPRVTTLMLTKEDGTIPPYVAGQYLTIYRPEGGADGKAYTVSSAPCERRLAISVKAVGAFSNRLAALRPGDVIAGSLPYGYFYSESRDTPLVMLASGIGVTPFRSMIVESAVRNPTRPLTLFYGARTLAEAAFKDEFDRIAGCVPAFRVCYFVTGEPAMGVDIFAGRMDAGRVLGLAPDSANREFLVCGSIAFVRDLWRGLRAHGVSEESLYTEAFFS
jgi:CDP-4-dehydro-6-deoxyglucose reductase